MGPLDPSYRTKESPLLLLKRSTPYRFEGSTRRIVVVGRDGVRSSTTLILLWSGYCLDLVFSSLIITNDLGIKREIFYHSEISVGRSVPEKLLFTLLQ